MIQKPIFLIGFMASGKTKLGKKIAKRLNLEFLDLDSHIEERYLESINSIFKDRGEEAFRKIEYNVLKELSFKKPTIVSLGGGTPCYMDNMEFIKKTGKSIYLKLSPEILIGRLRADKVNRPLVANLNDFELVEFVKSTLKERELDYKKADYTFNLKLNSFDKLIKICST